MNSENQATDDYQQGPLHKGTASAERRDDPLTSSPNLKLIREGKHGSLLPTLATTGDAREVVKFLKKRPIGVTMVEAMNADQRRIFEPRKVSAYEFWGLVSRNGERLKLTPFGLELARRLEPEIRIYRAIIESTPPYRSALEWASQKNLEALMHGDVAHYWQLYHRQALGEYDERMIEAAVLSFFYVCQAAELGTVTIGKRGQRARLRVERDELVGYLKSGPTRFVVPAASGEKDEMSTATVTRGPAQTAASSGIEAAEGRRILISGAHGAKAIEQIKVILELVNCEAEIVQRAQQGMSPVDEILAASMRRSHAAIILVSDGDFVENQNGDYALGQDILVLIGAALVLYDRRVALVWDDRFTLPANLRGLDHCTFDGHELTWAAGVELMRFIKYFER
jgi:CAP12/Pycsar effector protein, TIR domain